MGDGVEIFRQPEVRIVLVRVVVHGIRYRSYIHVPVLALASESKNRRRPESGPNRLAVDGSAPRMPKYPIETFFIRQRLHTRRDKFVVSGVKTTE